MQLANSDPEGAAMMGVNVTYMRFLTFGISAALACSYGQKSPSSDPSNDAGCAGSDGDLVS